MINQKNNQKGTALLIAMSMILMLAVISSAVLYVPVSQAKGLTYQQKYYRAYGALQAGIAHAIIELNKRTDAGTYGNNNSKIIAAEDTAYEAANPWTLNVWTNFDKHGYGKYKINKLPGTTSAEFTLDVLAEFGGDQDAKRVQRRAIITVKATPEGDPIGTPVPVTTTTVIPGTAFRHALYAGGPKKDASGNTIPYTWGTTSGTNQDRLRGYPPVATDYLGTYDWGTATAKGNMYVGGPLTLNQTGYIQPGGTVRSSGATITDNSTSVTTTTDAVNFDPLTSTSVLVKTSDPLANPDIPDYTALTNQVINVNKTDFQRVIDSSVPDASSTGGTQKGNVVGPPAVETTTDTGWVTTQQGTNLYSSGYPTTVGGVKTLSTTGSLPGTLTTKRVTLVSKNNSTTTSRWTYAKQTRVQTQVYDNSSASFEAVANDPRHIFVYNPNPDSGTWQQSSLVRTMRTKDTFPTDRANFFLEDKFSGSSATNWQPNTRVIGTSVDQESKYDAQRGQLLSIDANGNDKIYMVDGNLWLNNSPTLTYLFNSCGDTGTHVTFAVYGNIYLGDNMLYTNLLKDAVALIALKRPDDYRDEQGNLPSGLLAERPSASGNIRFGDPDAGTTYRFAAFMYAERNFCTSNVSSALYIYGNMTAGNTVDISKGTGTSWLPLTIDYDARIELGLITLPGLPTSEQVTTRIETTISTEIVYSPVEGYLKGSFKLVEMAEVWNNPSDSAWTH